MRHHRTSGKSKGQKCGHRGSKLPRINQPFHKRGPANWMQGLVTTCVNTAEVRTLRQSSYCTCGRASRINESFIDRQSHPTGVIACFPMSVTSLAEGRGGKAMPTLQAKARRDWRLEKGRKRSLGAALWSCQRCETPRAINCRLGPSESQSSRHSGNRDRG